MPAPTRTAPAVTEDLLARIASDPDWTARVLCAAATALNILMHRAQPGGFIRPGAEHFGATEVLQHAFIDWEAVHAALNDCARL